MLKLGKTSWLVLTVGILVIAFVGIGAARMQKVKEQYRLYEEFTVAEKRLTNLDLDPLYSQHEELESRLSQATSKLETAKSKLSRPTGSIAASGALLGIADASGVELIDISSSGLAGGALEGLKCSVLPLTAMVEGDAAAIIDFVMMVNSDFAAGVVKSVDISVSGNVTGGKSTANIQMIIYSYQGD